MADATASARAEISRLHRAPEPEVLAPLLKAAKLSPESRRRVESRALAMLAELRSTQASGWVNQFLQEYRLNKSEGIALLSLRSEEHTSELQSLMRISYAVFCFKKNNNYHQSKTQCT